MLVIIASGAKKAKALARTIEEGVNHMCPSSALQMHPDASIVCDRIAATGLSSQTLNVMASAH
jgi:glucosamine-6-phosphate deaminase